jgi:hypothetical protein
MRHDGLGEILVCLSCEAVRSICRRGVLRTRLEAFGGLRGSDFYLLRSVYVSHV